MQKTIDQSTVTEGPMALEKFLPFLTMRSKDITTPCETFANVELGHTYSAEGAYTGFSIVWLEPGGEHPQHSHQEPDATFHFLGGKGYVILGENQDKIPYCTGTVVEAPQGVLHGFEVEEAGPMLSIQKGASIRRPDGTLDIHYVNPNCFTEHGTVGGS